MEWNPPDWLDQTKNIRNQEYFKTFYDSFSYLKLSTLMVNMLHLSLSYILLTLAINDEIKILRCNINV